MYTIHFSVISVWVTPPFSLGTWGAKTEITPKHSMDDFKLNLSNYLEE